MHPAPHFFPRRRCVPVSERNCKRAQGLGTIRLCAYASCDESSPAQSSRCVPWRSSRRRQIAKGQARSTRPGRWLGNSFSFLFSLAGFLRPAHILLYSMLEKPCRFGGQVTAPDSDVPPFGFNAFLRPRKHSRLCCAIIRPLSEAALPNTIGS